MRIMVTGSRNMKIESYFMRAMRYFKQQYGPVTHLVVGGDKSGLDGIAFRWARDNNISYTVISADWDKGRRAGPERNSEMVEFAKVIGVKHCLGFWDGKEERSGTLDTLRKAKKAEIETHVWKLYENDHTSCSSVHSNVS